MTNLMLRNDIAEISAPGGRYMEVQCCHHGNIKNITKYNLYSSTIVIKILIKTQF